MEERVNQLLAMRTFVRVVEAGSFSRAADQLSIPRSTVSKLIADLERHLGAKLIQRTTRTATVTPEGADYYGQIAPLVIELDEIDAAIRGKRVTPQGRLRVEVTSSFANLFLIPALPDFMRKYPEVVLEVGITDRTVDIVGEGVDCAIRVGELRDTTLIARRLFVFTNAVCASPQYLARKGTPLTPEELRRDHDIVGYFSAATSRPLPLVLQRGDQREEIDRFNILANESTGHVTMLLAGLGIGQNIREIMQPHINSGELVTVLDDWSQPQMPFHLLYPPNRHQSARLRAFIDWIVSRTSLFSH